MHIHKIHIQDRQIVFLARQCAVCYILASTKVQKSVKVLCRIEGYIKYGKHGNFKELQSSKISNMYLKGKKARTRWTLIRVHTSAKTQQSYSCVSVCQWWNLTCYCHDHPRNICWFSLTDWSQREKYISWLTEYVLWY